MSKILTSGKTDAGRRRANNEDTFIQMPQKGLLAVADGMGGAASGEVASTIFAETVLTAFSDFDALSEGELYTFVQHVFIKANAEILDLASLEPMHRGMGCTAELLVFRDNRYILGHVGDSRTYLFRHGNLRQITKDHSLVQFQADRGIFTIAEANRRCGRNIILRAVGIEEPVTVDFVRGKSFPDDIFLLCSDGLTDLVNDEAILNILGRHTTLDEIAEKLVEKAIVAGGDDNITVVLGKVMIENDEGGFHGDA